MRDGSKIEFLNRFLCNFNFILDNSSKLFKLGTTIGRLIRIIKIRFINMRIFIFIMFLLTW
jgi:hypothetical protein